jgi:serine/threonine protein kinase
MGGAASAPTLALRGSSRYTIGIERDILSNEDAVAIKRWRRRGEKQRLESICAICEVKRPDAPQWVARSLGGVPLQIESFVVETVIGEGLSGCIVLASFAPSKGGERFCVLKKVEKETLLARPAIRDQIQNEKAALTKIGKHPFIVTLFGTFQCKQSVYMCLDFACGGELLTLLRLQGRFSNDQAQFYAAELLSAIQHIHRQGFVYRDLKPENVCLDEFGHVKLVDFGTCKQIPKTGRCISLVGTVEYLSPEQIRDALLPAAEREGYTAAVDWWAWAALTYEMLTGKPTVFSASVPSPTLQQAHQLVVDKRKRKKLSFPSCVDNKARAMLRSMLTADLSTRLCTADEIQSHPWFAERNLNWCAVQMRALKAPHLPTVHCAGDASNFREYARPHCCDVAAGVTTTPGGLATQPGEGDIHAAFVGGKLLLKKHGQAYGQTAQRSGGGSRGGDKVVAINAPGHER